MNTIDKHADLPCFRADVQRRKGFPSETRVKRGLRFVRGGPENSNSVELVEKLGRNDPCPCGSGKRFQALLYELGPVSTVARGRIIGGDWRSCRTNLPSLGLIQP
ncbi:MAG: SEC-C metal-binding domain-containing protein [Sphingomonas sp.]